MRCDYKSCSIAHASPPLFVCDRHLAEGYEILRRELYWPWNGDQTWKGIKQFFSIALMLLGIFVIIRFVFPNVSANDCQPTMSADLSSVISKHGLLAHNDRPLI